MFFYRSQNSNLHAFCRGFLYKNSNQNPPELQVDFRQNLHGISIFQLELTRRWNNCKNPGGITKRFYVDLSDSSWKLQAHGISISGFFQMECFQIVFKNPPGNSQGQEILGLIKFLSTSIFLSWNFFLSGVSLS